MKKIVTIALAALLAGSVVGSYSAQAKEEVTQAIEEKEQVTTNFMKATGVIQEIEIVEVPEVNPEVPTALKEIIANDHYMKNGVKMIPLRKVAEHLDYHVLSQPKVNGALVTLDNSSFTIKRGDNMYGYNKSIRKFAVAPELKGMKTYVSEDILELLIQN